MKDLIDHSIPHTLQFLLQGQNGPLPEKEIRAIPLLFGTLGQSPPIPHQRSDAGTNPHQRPGMHRPMQEFLGFSVQCPLERIMPDPTPFGPPVLQFKGQIHEHPV